MSADLKLKALFAEDLPPPRDLVFQESVLQALDRRILWQEVSILVAACGAGIVLIWMLLPTLEPMLVGLGRLVTPGLTILVLGALLFCQGLPGARPSRS